MFKIDNIGEGERYFWQIITIFDISDKLNVNIYLVTVNDKNFLLVVFKKIGFGNNLTDWIKILLTNQESSIINSGSTTPYFKIRKRCLSRWPNFCFSFIIASETNFATLKSNPNIKGLNIFNHNYLYTAYADNTTFF